MRILFLACSLIWTLAPASLRADTAKVIPARHNQVLQIDGPAGKGSAMRLFSILEQADPKAVRKLSAGGREVSVGMFAVVANDGYHGRISFDRTSTVEVGVSFAKLSGAIAEDLYQLMDRGKVTRVTRNGTEPATWTATLSAGPVSCSREFFQGDSTWKCILWL